MQNFSQCIAECFELPKRERTLVIQYLISSNKTKGLKVAKEDQSFIGLIVDRLDG